MRCSTDHHSSVLYGDTHGQARSLTNLLPTWLSVDDEKKEARKGSGYFYGYILRLVPDAAYQRLLRFLLKRFQSI
jgi:hypothetical protein